MRMPKRWLVSLLGGLFLVFALPSLAVETNVYGNPGSSNFSIAMAVTADEEGNLYTVGVFYGSTSSPTCGYEKPAPASTGWTTTPTNTTTKPSPSP